MERTMADDAREIVEILDKGSPEAEEIIMWWRERQGTGPVDVNWGDKPRRVITRVSIIQEG